MSEISSFKVDWHGPMVEKKVIDAVKWGMESTMADCVVTAKSVHNWKNRTNHLHGSIAWHPAKIENGAIVGEWGSFVIEYAEHLERAPRFKGRYTWLVPASERHYPSLPLRIRAKLAWG